MSEEYNGWANRETWCLNLWLSNVEGLYDAVRQIATDNNTSDMAAGEAIMEWFDDLQEWAEETYRQIRDDVGSLWRVDVAELGEAWLEE